MEEHHYVEYKKPKRKLGMYTGIFIASVILFVILLTGNHVQTLNNPPSNFPTSEVIEIPLHSTVDAVLDILVSRNVIQSKLYTKYQIKNREAEGDVKAGMYYFSEPLSSEEVVTALLEGSYQSAALTLTLPEGFRVREIANYFPDAYSGDISGDITQYEGYLFPDTYYITNDMSFEDVVTLLNDTFYSNIKTYEQQMEKMGLTVEELVILASILEREANSEESMRIVSGILLNRLEIDMPLQVDATFNYILGKTSEELTIDDLAMDSPYNTYINKGLPPTPIANPGLLALDAVLNPTKTDYLYYLTGNDGEFYYATTFEEHRDNKFRYLR